MKTKYTKELLSEKVASSFSWAEVLRKLNLKQTGGNHTNIQTICKYYEIDFSHFTGSAWAKDLTSETNPSLKSASIKLRTPDSDIFISNCRPIPGPKVIKRLLQLGWEYRCKICGLTEWLNKPLTLHLDHINGIHNDNRLVNLQLLCPNCHQQTDTWGNKKRNPS